MQAQKRGRPNLLTRIWRTLWGGVTRAFRGRQNSASQWANSVTIEARNYDLEITELPVRDTSKARELIEIREHCAEAGTAVMRLSGDVFSSSDGDDYGVIVSELAVDESALDPEVLDISRACLRRVLPLSTLKMAVDRLLSYGDAFGELQIDFRTSSREIVGLQMLPTWEIFRVVEGGNLTRFEQRRFLQDRNAIAFHPVEIVHWRFQLDHLYGRSLWMQSIEDWVNFKQSINNYIRAGNEIGVNPWVHTMPENTTAQDANTYRRNHEDRLKKGIATNLYVNYGGSIAKAANNDPDLSALEDQVKLFRDRLIARSGLPAWMFNVFHQGAMNLAEQPSLAYARYVNGIRGVLSEGIKQVLHTELALKGIPEERWKDQIVLAYPKIYSSVHLGQEIEVAESDEHPDTESKSGLRVVGGSHAVRP